MEPVLKIALVIFAVVAGYGVIYVLKLLAGRVSKNRLIMVGAICLAWFNFFLTFVLHAFLGGRAALGMIKDGRYYVREFDRYTEVSANLYWGDIWYTRISEVLFASAFVIMGYLLLRAMRKDRTSQSKQ